MKIYIASVLLFHCLHQLEALSCNPGLTPVGIACAECIQGTYKPGFNGNPCTACPPGSTTQASGRPALTDCNTCILNFYGSGTPADCTMCPNDRVTVGTGTTDLSGCLCPEGQFLLNEACVLCPAGFFSDGISRYCEDCSRILRSSTTDLQGSTSSDDCICGPGRFLDEDSAGVMCKKCPVGTSKSNSGDGDCDDCAIGSYAPYTGLNKCWTCPYGTTTEGVGSFTSANCVCDAGFEGDGPYGCQACPDGTTSEVGNEGACVPVPPTDVPVPAPVPAPVATPVAVPVAVPVTVPVAVPVAVPVETPVAVPVAVPVATPVASIPDNDDEDDDNEDLFDMFFGICCF